MGSDANDGLNLQDLERELAELAARRSVLLRERGLFRRLGFSTERLNFSLRQVESRRSQCEGLLRRLQGGNRGAPARLNGAHLETPRAT